MNVFIRQQITEPGHYEWFKTSEDALKPEHFKGSLEDLGEFVKFNPTIRHWILVVSGLELVERKISFSAKEKKHIAKALPYLLEDELLSDADNLHIVASKPQETDISVIAVEQKKLQAWLEELKEAGVVPTHCLPESKLISQSTNTWQIYYRHGEFIFKNEEETLAFEAEHFPLAVELLTKGFSELPDTIELVADDEEALEEAAAHIPETIREAVFPKTIDYGFMIQSGFNEQGKIWNLLRGQFAQSRDWLAKLLPWKWVIVSLLMAFVLHLVMITVDIFDAKAVYAENQKQIEAAFRQAIPKGKMQAPERQLENLLSSLQGSGGESRFTESLYKLGSVLEKQDIQAFNALNFNDKQSEFRIDIIVPKYDMLQSIIDDLQAVGLTGEIINSTAQGELMSAKMRVKL